MSGTEERALAAARVAQAQARTADEVVAEVSADRDTLLELVRSMHRVLRSGDPRYGGSALEADVKAALAKSR